MEKNTIIFFNQEYIVLRILVVEFIFHQLGCQFASEFLFVLFFYASTKCPEKMRCSFCLIFLATNMLEGWDIIHWYQISKCLNLEKSSV